MVIYVFFFRRIESIRWLMFLRIFVNFFNGDCVGGWLFGDDVDEILEKFGVEFGEDVFFN